MPMSNGHIAMVDMIMKESRAKIDSHIYLAVAEYSKSLPDLSIPMSRYPGIFCTII